MALRGIFTVTLSFACQTSTTMITSVVWASGILGSSSELLGLGNLPFSFSSSGQGLPDPFCSYQHRDRLSIHFAPLHVQLIPDSKFLQFEIPSVVYFPMAM